MRKIFILIVIFAGVCLHAQASRVFYYYSGERIFLDKVENTQIVRFKETAIASQRDYMRSLMELTDYAVVRINPLTYKVRSTEVLHRDDGAIAAMRANENILYISDLLMYRDSTLLWADNRMDVRIYPGSDLRDILQRNNIPFISFKRQVGFNQETYSVELNIAENSAIDYANRLSETGSVVWASPHFWILIPNRTHTNRSYQHIQQIQQLHNNSNPLFHLQWGLHNTGQHGIDINVMQAWNITSGRGIRVAVLDEGINLTHPDLIGNLLPGYDATDGWLSGVNGGAHLGNPNYCYRFDPCFSGEPLCDKGNPHGTACAGIIGAKNNDIGIIGVAYNAYIIPIRIGYTISFLHDVWGCMSFFVIYGDWAARGIYKAWSYFGADILSNAWDVNPNQRITDAVNEAVRYGRNSLGSLLVFASGNLNNPQPSFPANLPNVMAVGAITPSGQRADFSCFGDALDIVAPGVNILTTDIQGCMGYSRDDYVFLDGTSFAAPHVAGVAALVLSVNPNLTERHIRNIIKRTARRVRSDLYTYDYVPERPNSGTWYEQVGHGLVDAYAAVKEAIRCITLTVNFTNQTVSSNRTEISCGSINVQNITVTNGATLILDASGDIDIENLTVANNSNLILYAGGNINLGAGFSVELGSSFSIR